MKFFQLSKELKVFTLVVAVVLIILFLRSPKRVSTDFFGNDLSKYSTITCSFDQLTNAKFEENKIIHYIPDSEKDPIIFTFSRTEGSSDLDRLSYIDATRTITNVPVLRLTEDADKIIYLDGTGNNYFSVYTIYKKQGVAIYSKSTIFLDVPSATSGIGKCSGY